MTTEAKWNECFKARALAGLNLRGALESVHSLMDDGPAKQEIAQQIAEYDAAVLEARQTRDAE